MNAIKARFPGHTSQLSGVFVFVSEREDATQRGIGVTSILLSHQTIFSLRCINIRRHRFIDLFIDIYIYKTDR